MTDSYAPPPPFDPACQAAYEALPAQVPPMSDDVLAAAQQRPTPALADLALDGAFQVSEVDADGIPLVVCRPIGVDGPTPCLYLLHHGGMILGNRFEGALPVLMLLAQPLGVTLISAGYRLAPTVRAPTLAEDAYSGLRWVGSHAEQLSVDPTRLLLMGVSGGGGLAASCAFMARDRGGPALRGQLLVYPMLDDRNDTPSSSQMKDVGIWRRADNDYAWRKVLGERYGADDLSYVDAAARATDFSGLPPTFLDAGDGETFRDEIVDFARQIWLAGGNADLHIWGGGFHGFDLVGALTPLGQASWHTKRDWVARRLQE